MLIKQLYVFNLIAASLCHRRESERERFPCFLPFRVGKRSNKSPRDFGCLFVTKLCVVRTLEFWMCNFL